MLRELALYQTEDKVRDVQGFVTAEGVRAVARFKRSGLTGFMIGLVALGKTLGVRHG